MNLEGNTMKGFSATLCTVGGFVVGTSALRMLLLDFSEANPIKQQTLRGSRRSSLAGATSTFGNGKEPEVDADELSQGSLRAPSSSDDTSLQMHLFDFSSASTDVALSNNNGELEIDASDLELDDVHEWGYDEGLPIVSNRTKQELQEGMLPKGGAVSRRTSNLFDPPTNAKYRLKLFWKNGYFWQESHEETWWCMACGEKGHCKEGEVLRLRYCEKKSHKDALFQVIRQHGGDLLKIADKDLCLEGRRNFELKPCDRNNKSQQFKGFDGSGKAFDLRPRRSPMRCLTNHHHPRRNEVIFAQECRRAHRTKTGYWVAY